MYKRVVAVGYACLINDACFASGSDSGQMTFWVGHVTLFTRNTPLFTWLCSLNSMKK